MDNCIQRQECDTCKDLYDAKIDALDDRLSNVESDVKQIQALAIAVEKMAVSLEQMAKELERQGKRLETIENEPAEKWKKAVWLVVAGLIGAALSFMLTHLGVQP